MVVRTDHCFFSLKNDHIRKCKESIQTVRHVHALGCWRSFSELQGLEPKAPHRHSPVHFCLLLLLNALCAPPPSPRLSLCLLLSELRRRHSVEHVNRKKTGETWLMMQCRSRRRLDTSESIRPCVADRLCLCINIYARLLRKFRCVSDNGAVTSELSANTLQWWKYRFKINFVKIFHHFPLFLLNFFKQLSSRKKLSFYYLTLHFC